MDRILPVFIETETRKKNLSKRDYYNRKIINLLVFSVHLFYGIYFSVLNLKILTLIAFFTVFYMLFLFFLPDKFKTRLLIFINYLVILLANFLYGNFFSAGNSSFIFHFIPTLITVPLLFDLKNELKLSLSVIALILFFYVLEFLPIPKLFDNKNITDRLLYINIILFISITLYESYCLIVRFKDITETNEKTNSDKEISHLLTLAQGDEIEFLNHFRMYLPDFNDKLLAIAPDLTLTELSVCAYAKLMFTSKEISQYTKNSVKAIETRRYRARKKLNIANEKDFQSFLYNL